MLKMSLNARSVVSDALRSTFCCGFALWKGVGGWGGSCLMLVSCMRLVKEMHKNDVGNSHSNPIAGDHLHIPPVRSRVACSVMWAERPCAAVRGLGSAQIDSE